MAPPETRPSTQPEPVPFGSTALHPPITRGAREPMTRLNIAGQVLYADFTPAAQASVKIVEQDRLPGGDNDRILTRTTDANGRFSGLSAEWNDREGVLFGVDVPDVLQLTFT